MDKGEVQWTNEGIGHRQERRLGGEWKDGWEGGWLDSVPWDLGVY